MDVVFPGDHDQMKQRRRVPCSLGWLEAEQALWVVLIAFERSMRQQHLDQRRLPCSVFVNLLFISPLNKLLNRLLWVHTSLTPISCSLVKSTVHFDLPYLSISLLHILSRLL